MENLAAQSIVLDSTYMRELEALDRNLHYATGRFMLRAEESTDILWDPEDDLFTFKNLVYALLGVYNDIVYH